MPNGRLSRRLTPRLARRFMLLVLVTGAGCQRFPLRYAEVTPESTSKPVTQVEPARVVPELPSSASLATVPAPAPESVASPSSLPDATTPTSLAPVPAEVATKDQTEPVETAPAAHPRPEALIDEMFQKASATEEAKDAASPETPKAEPPAPETTPADAPAATDPAAKPEPADRPETPTPSPAEPAPAAAVPDLEPVEVVKLAESKAPEPAAEIKAPEPAAAEPKAPEPAPVLMPEPRTIEPTAEAPAEVAPQPTAPAETPGPVPVVEETQTVEPTKEPEPQPESKAAEVETKPIEPEKTSEPEKAPESEKAPEPEPAAPPEKTSEAVPSTDDWHDGLARLREFSRRKAGEPDDAAQAWAIRSRVLDWLAGEGPMPGDETNRVWNSVLATLSTATGPETPDGPTLAYHLSEAVEALESYAPLQMTALCFCRKIDGFGHYDPIDSPAVKGGQPLLIYCEMAGLNYEARQDDYCSRLSSRVEIVKADGGQVAWSETLGTAEDVCRRRRRDYFVNYRIVVPAKLAPGNYALRLSQTDLLSNRTVSGLLPFAVKP